MADCGDKPVLKTVGAVSLKNPPPSAGSMKTLFDPELVTNKLGKPPGVFEGTNRDPLADARERLEAAVAIAGQGHHVAQLISHNEVHDPVAIEIADRQTIGQIAGVVSPAGNKAAVAVATEDCNCVVVGIEHGQV